MQNSIVSCITYVIVVVLVLSLLKRRIKIKIYYYQDQHLLKMIKVISKL